jgi:hypothetical protein
LVRLVKRENYFVVDSNDRRFEVTDNLFVHVTMKGVQPVTTKHGAQMSSMKARVQLLLKDNREKVEIRFGDEKLEFEKGVYKTYRSLVTENREAFHLPVTWPIAAGRTVEDRIIMECADGAEPFWFSEKACLPLLQTADKLREAAKNAAPEAWGRAVEAPPLTIQTRAKWKAAAKAGPLAASELPAKLIGDGLGVQKASVPVFTPTSTAELIPGRVGQILTPDEFKNCRLRQGDMIVKVVDLRVQITGEEERQAHARNGASIEEILGGAFMAEDIPAEDKFKLTTKPVCVY